MRHRRARRPSGDLGLSEAFQNLLGSIFAIGVMVAGTALGVGTFEVYAKVTDSPEIPVLNCGSFRIV